MTFAWQGFRLEHPEDWSPVSLVGDRKEGYVRIASSGRLAIHVRWAKGRNDSPKASLVKYLDRLSQEAQKQKVDFKREISDDSSPCTYTYRGVYHGRGSVQAIGDRVFFLEVLGGRTDSTLPAFRQTSASFVAETSAQVEEWALFGLHLRLPKGPVLKSKVLQAGRTVLEFGGPCKISAERWAFAEQLLAKHPLADWGQAVLKSKPVDVQEVAEGVRLIHRSGLTGQRESLIVHQPDRNQLVVMDVRFRDPKWRPRWDWLT